MVDGVLDGIGILLIGPPNNSGTTFLLGSYSNGGGGKLTGNMDEVKVWDHARSTSEIIADAGINSPTPTLTPTLTPTETPTPTPSPTITPTPTPTPIPGLVAYWKIEEGSGSSTFIDSSGHGRDMFISGPNASNSWDNSTPPTSVNPDTKSYNFDGTNYGFLTHPNDNAAFNLPGGFTIEAWVKANASQNGDPAIIAKWAGNGYLLWLPNGNLGRLESKFNGENLSSLTNIKDDNWHHLAVSWNGITEKIYIDGVEEGSRVNLTPPDSSADFFLATYIFGQPQFIGNLDEIKVWDVARTEAEIRSDGGVTIIPLKM